MEAARRRWMVLGLLAEVVGIGALTATLAVGRTATPALPLTSAAGTHIWHEDPLTLRPGRPVDLDAPQYDPEWGPNDRQGPGTAFDVEFGPEGLRPAGWAFGTTLVLAGSEPCTDATGYAAAPIPAAVLTPGARVCVRTGNGRLSLMEVTGPRAFYVTTFDSP